MIDFQAMAMLRGTRRWGPAGPLKGKHYLRVFFCEECSAMRLSRVNSTSKYCKSCSCKGARSFRWKGGITIGNQGIEAKRQYYREKTAAWKLRNPDYKQPRQHSKEEWNALVLKRKEQIAGRPCPDHCEVCGKYCPIKTRVDNKLRLCFDHDHKTGKFRGWICHGCNVSLGGARDNIDILKKLILYLEEHSHGVH